MLTPHEQSLGVWIAVKGWTPSRYNVGVQQSVPRGRRCFGGFRADRVEAIVMVVVSTAVD